MIVLLNRQTGEDEPSELVTPIGAQDIGCFASEWRPLLDAKIQELKDANLYTAQGVADHNLEDAGWKWPDKVRDRTGSLEWNSFALRCAGRTQGMMFANMLRRCRSSAQKDQHLVYVDLVSTAPWNRAGFSATPLYRGVGLVLVTEAILLSRAEGFKGRIGLHALPKAEAYYRNEWGMDSLGPDPLYDNLHYFELSEGQAQTFLGIGDENEPGEKP
jgi:hypothetical protein